MTDQQTSRTNITEDDDFEEMLAGFDRLLHDKKLQQDLIDAGLLVRTDAADPRSDAVTAPDEPHRDYAGRTCTTGLMHAHAAPDEPSTFAGKQALAASICKCGLAKSYHDGPRFDHKYEPRYHIDKQMVVAIEREARAASASVPPPALDESTLARALHEHRGHPLPGACSYCEQDAHVIFGIAEVRGYAAETPEQGRGDE